MNNYQTSLCNDQYKNGPSKVNLHALIAGPP